MRCVIGGTDQYMHKPDCLMRGGTVAKREPLSACAARAAPARGAPTPPAPMTPAAELAAREAIRDLVARYNALGDAGRLGALCELFAEDAVLELDGRRCAGRGAIRALFESAAEEARSGDGVRLLRHFTATHVIDLAERRPRERPALLPGADRARSRPLGPLPRRRTASTPGAGASRERRATVDGLVPGGWAERTLRRVGAGS